MSCPTICPNWNWPNLKKRSERFPMMRQFWKMALIACVMVNSAPAMGQPAESGYVLQAAGRLLFIDKGEQDNVRPGDLLQVVRQEVIRHPETGENLAGEVILGAVRVVEVFPRLSTAEVVHLVRGMTIETIDMEARQGIIRIKPLPPEEEMAIRQNLQARQAGQAEVRSNPDGRIRKIAPEIRLGFGSRPAGPDRVYQLIDPTAVIDDHLSGLPLPETAYANVQPRELLGLMDTVGVEPVALGSAIQVQVGAAFPISARATALAYARFGAQSAFAGGVRVYPGRLLGFLGEGYTPDGRVGEPALTLMVGLGGRGAQSLSGAARAQLTQSTVTAGAAYLSALEDAQVAVYVDAAVENQQAVADSLLQADMTGILQQVAVDTLKAINNRGLGVQVGLALPVARHVTLKGQLTHWGNVKEVGGGLTYYWRAVAPGEPKANPDGMVRTPVFTAGGRYDLDAKAGLFDVEIGLPMSPKLTLSGTVQSNFGSYTRFGLVLKRY